MSVSRFYIKTANLATVFPAVAGPAVGGFTGRVLGAKYPALGVELGSLLGSVGGGVGGQLLRERLEQGDVPYGAPYAMDPGSDIPPWAIQGARLLQPALKQGSALDWILGEVPGGNVIQRGLTQGVGGAGRAFAGMSLGGVPGSMLGLGVGRGVERLVGRKIEIPGLHITLPELLAGLGGSVGATKGLQRLAPERGE